MKQLFLSKRPINNIIEFWIKPFYFTKVSELPLYAQFIYEMCDWLRENI